MVTFINEGDGRMLKGPVLNPQDSLIGGIKNVQKYIQKSFKIKMYSSGSVDYLLFQLIKVEDNIFISKTEYGVQPYGKVRNTNEDVKCISTGGHVESAKQTSQMAKRNNIKR